jgi:hypothetical protein
VIGGHCQGKYENFTFAYSESTTLPTCSRVSMAAPYIFCGVMSCLDQNQWVDGNYSTHIRLGLIKYQQATSSLIQNTMKYLVKDHLRESEDRQWNVEKQGRLRNKLGFDSLPRLSDGLSDIFNLYD